MSESLGLFAHRPGGRNLLIAVYGTLKQGGYNHDYLENADFIGSNRTEPDYSLYNIGGLPAAVKGGSTALQIEVYQVDQQDLKMIDLLEGHPTFYRRETIQLQKIGAVEIYLWQGQITGAMRKMPDGNWPIFTDLSDY